MFENNPKLGQQWMQVQRLGSPLEKQRFLNQHPRFARQLGFNVAMPSTQESPPPAVGHQAASVAAPPNTGDPALDAAVSKLPASAWQRPQQENW